MKSVVGHECAKCKSVFKSKFNLERHQKNVCKNTTPSPSSVSSTSSNTETNTDMMILILRQMEELKKENLQLKERVLFLEEENKSYQEFVEMSATPSEKPIPKNELYDLVFKYNPYLRSVSLYSNGYTPKDTRQRYVLNCVDKDAYPENKVTFYKKCFQNILKNIPDAKLPYRLRDKSRHIYDIYDYENNCWLRGNTTDLIKYTVTPIAMMVHATLTSAICNLNVYCDVKMLYMLYKVQNFDKREFQNIQVTLTDRYSLPNYNMRVDEEEIDSFYRRNFIQSCFNERVLTHGKNEECKEEDHEEHEEQPDEEFDEEFEGHSDEEDGYNSDSS